MIEFACTGCGKKFAVADELQGRQARCKACGATVVVPPKAAAGPARISPRTRRLAADARQMTEAFAGFPLIQVRPIEGNPPERYQVDYAVQSLDQENGELKVRETHTAEITLTSEYPRMAPACKMLTSIFHPNIDESHICVGDHWAAGERLTDLVIRIGEMIAYQAYNIKSPLNGEAAMWADLNGAKLPTDSRELRPAALE